MRVVGLVGLALIVAALVLARPGAAEEFARGHIDGAVNIPAESLGSRLSEVPRDVPVVVCLRSATAAELLAQASDAQGYDLGGIQTWEAEGRPVVR